MIFYKNVKWTNNENKKAKRTNATASQTPRCEKSNDHEMYTLSDSDWKYVAGCSFFIPGKLAFILLEKISTQQCVSIRIEKISFLCACMKLHYGVESPLVIRTAGRSDIIRIGMLCGRNNIGSYNRRSNFWCNKSILCNCINSESMRKRRITTYCVASNMLPLVGSHSVYVLSFFVLFCLDRRQRSLSFKIEICLSVGLTIRLSQWRRLSPFDDISETASPIFYIHHLINGIL